MAALSLPVKDVADAIRHKGEAMNNNSMLSRRKSMTVSNATIEAEEPKGKKHRYMDS